MENQPDMSQFNADELLSLGWIASQYAGKNTTEQREVTEEQRRLEFARYLADHDIINEGK